MSKKTTEKNIKKPGSQMERLGNLPSWPEARNMLEDSKSVSEVVYFLQEVRAEYVQIKPRSLEKAINHWLELHRKEMANCQKTIRCKGLLKSTSERIDPLAAINLLAVFQFERVMMNFSLEQKIRRTLTTTTQSMKLAHELLLTMARIQNNTFNYKRAVFEYMERDPLDAVNLLFIYQFERLMTDYKLERKSESDSGFDGICKNTA